MGVKKGSYTGLGLLLIFLGPLFGAYCLFYFQDKIDFKSMCHGTLISPPLQSEILSLHEKKLLGKWQMVFVIPDICDDTCKQSQQMLHSIQLALGKEKSRVETRHIPMAFAPMNFEKQGLFIIDPKGWVILHYPSLSNPKGVLKDMERLLRYSQIG